MKAAGNAYSVFPQFPNHPTMEAFISYYLLLLITMIFLYSVIERIAGKIRNLPPSPQLYVPILGHLHLLKKPNAFANLADKYGPIVMLYFGSRRVLLVSSSSAVEECFTKNDVVFANRPRFLAGEYLGQNYTTLFWASYGDLWRRLRKLAVVELLSGKQIKTHESLRREEVHSMMQGLVKAAEADESGVVDLKPMFFELVRRIVMRMTAGKREYHGGEDEKKDEARKFREMVEESIPLNFLTTVADHIPWSRWIGGRRKILRMLETSKAKTNEFIQILIEERRNSINRKISTTTTSTTDDHDAHKCMIDVLLSLHKNEPEFYTEEIIRGVVQVMLLGGTETTTYSMEWAFSLLLRHPNILKRAYEEIQNQIGESNRLIDDSDLHHLPFLQAIIDETLRMYPIGPIISHHEASGGCTVGGYTIPQGTILLVNHQAMQNHPKVWEDPTKFKPERFLNMNKEQIGLNFLPFGYGRRGCPGETLARKIMALTLGLLIQCFEWNRVNEELLDTSEKGLGPVVPKATRILAKCKLRPEIANHHLALIR